MEKNILLNLVDRGLTQREISNAIGIGLTATQYWLKRHQIETVRTRKRRIPIASRKCDLCGREVKKGAKCNYCRVRMRRIRVKAASIAYKGGKCEECGYSKSLSALEFHHIDGKTKSFGIGSSRANKSWDSIVAELDKCRLLCANCHRETHRVEDAALRAAAGDIRCVRSLHLRDLAPEGLDMIQTYWPTTGP